MGDYSSLKLSEKILDKQLTEEKFKTTFKLCPNLLNYASVSQPSSTPTETKITEVRVLPTTKETESEVLSAKVTVRLTKKLNILPKYNRIQSIYHLSKQSPRYNPQELDTPTRNLTHT